MFFRRVFAESCGFMWCEEHTSYRHLRIRKLAEEALEEKGVGCILTNQFLKTVWSLSLSSHFCLPVFTQFLSSPPRSLSWVPGLSPIFCILLVDYFSSLFYFYENKQTKKKNEKQDLTMLLSLVFSLGFLFLSLSIAGITDRCHHVWPYRSGPF